MQQRIRYYRKRHSRHIQKQMAAERKGRQPTLRTLAAIKNNAAWVRFWEGQLRAKEAKYQEYLLHMEAI